MQLENSKVGIVVVTYNCEQIFLKHVEKIKKHCKDPFELIVIDNSTEQKTIDFISYHSIRLGLTYVKSKASSINGSQSHAFAANLSQVMFKNKFSHFLYLDHDCFPVKDFSVIKTLGEEKTMAGIGQGKLKTYLWPGCLMFKSDVEIDFSPNHEFKLDTGGNIYKSIEANPSGVRYFNETYSENPEFNKNFYSFYSLINNETFLHFINASNWNNKNDHQERINSLLNLLNK